MKRLLIVEDHELLRRGYVDTLSYISNEQLTIDEATTANKAIELINSASYDYIIIDGQLINSHGRQVLKEIKDADKKKVFVYSGDIAFLSEATKSGFFARTKNYSFAEAWKEFIPKANS